MENNQKIARTGRVQSWIDDPKPVGYLCRALCLLLKTLWRVQMELKQVMEICIARSPLWSWMLQSICQ